ncbi:hypothetical protein L915_04693 [Phytophthora nicotianae]|uniref:Uncharacterized protein n=1 Tax=Phytophthora nicotianae TaxID=4792 RepID=W2H974_PHYNI|nr:hypothetical protein L915_04693 [Phytophthora nicotianae]ETL45193.1 hypothetical protein L916_04652 [Phytophthora nicotianae]
MHSCNFTEVDAVFTAPQNALVKFISVQMTGHPIDAGSLLTYRRV